VKLSRWLGTLALVTISFAGLTACSTSTPSGDSANSEETAHEAGLFTKDIEVCFTNTSGSPVTVKWVEGLSTKDGEGTLDGGEILCAEGSYPTALVTYLSGFQTELQAVNPAFEKPFVRFLSYLPEDQQIEECDASTGMCFITKRRKEYASWAYSVGQSIDNTFEKHSILVTRTADNAWINFLVDIKN
jgi:hypothetical protein